MTAKGGGDSEIPGWTHPNNEKYSAMEKTAREVSLAPIYTFLQDIKHDNSPIRGTSSADLVVTCPALIEKHGIPGHWTEFAFCVHCGIFVCPTTWTLLKFVRCPFCDTDAGGLLDMQVQQMRERAEEDALGPASTRNFRRRKRLQELGLDLRIYSPSD